MIARGLNRMVSSYGAKAFNRSIIISRPTYMFCAQTPSQVKTKLLKIVEKESKYETENYQRDEAVDDFIKKIGFELIESEGDQNVELRKTVGDCLVIINFQSRSPDQDQDEEQDQQQSIEPESQNQQEENDQDQQEYSDFTVYIKKGNNKALCYECSSVQSEVQVNLVSVIDSVEDHQKTPRYERGVVDYSGPEFTTLDDRLQSALTQFLKSYGVNDEIAQFIEQYSLDKEQRLYMAWLKQLESYLKN